MSMLRAKWVGVGAALGVCVMGGGAMAQQPAPAFLDPALTPEARAADLVHRLTLTEKASQLVNQSRAIPRLDVPAYNWWSEALHGVINDGVTEFPEPIGLAATFDAPGIHQMATVIGVEARIKHAQAESAGHSNMFEGLDFWAPNVNIFRDPRWGRGQETYGEDPYLTARMAVAYVTGMQGDDAHYYRAIATPKHFAVHSGPEPTRHFADVDVSRHDEEDTYLPAFRAAVVEGHAGSVMCAYNALNGEPACASEFLLEHTLRGAWQFQGYVVSDCGAVRDIFAGHRFRPTQAQASAISLARGMDNECIDFSNAERDDSDYRPYIEAVQQGYLPERAIDTALIRLFSARIRLGLFDPPARVPYARIDARELDSPAHRELARQLAAESMVLLKNDGVLPLRSVRRIAVVGPLAEQTDVLLGNYNGRPSHTVSVLEGLRKEFPSAQIRFVRGTQFLSNDGDPVPAEVFSTGEGKPGLKAEYRRGMSFETGPQALLATRIEAGAALSQDSLPASLTPDSAFDVRWSGLLTPNASGAFLLGLKANGFARIALGGRVIMQSYSAGANLVRVELQQGQAQSLEVEYAHNARGVPAAQLIWQPVNEAPDPAARAAAEAADVVIAVIGITSHLEGEEMPIEQPGFAGGDRTSLEIPAAEEALLRAVASAGKPLVVILMNGSALGASWVKAHANAVLESWYAGEEGGTAIADTVSGRNNPAGRLPVTFYRDVSQLPPFEDYSMSGRTYRYFQGEPLWPFGYGLSYSSFRYEQLVLPRARIPAGEPLDVSVRIRNTGKLAGDEVAQLYLTFPDVAGAPRRALRGFRRIHLPPGASQQVSFHLEPRDLSMVSEAGEIIVAPGRYSLFVGGGQPGGDVPTLEARFEVSGGITLPE